MEQTCFCNLSLKRGTLLIARMDITGAIFQVIQYVYTLNLIVSYPEPKEQHPIFEEYKAVFIVCLVGGLITASVTGILSLLLLSGVHSHNPRNCTPWIYWKWVYLGVVALPVLVFIIIFWVKGYFAIGIGILAVFPIGLAIQIYLINVVSRFVAEIEGVNKLKTVEEL